MKFLFLCQLMFPIMTGEAGHEGYPCARGGKKTLIACKSLMTWVMELLSVLPESDNPKRFTWR